MSFTDEERAQWHRERREHRDGVSESETASDRHVCDHCKNPFSPSQGTVTPEISVCDTCLC